MTNSALYRTEIPEMGFVELLDVMGDDLAIVNAARVSYLGESKGEESDTRLLNYLMKHRHTSPFEQVVLKFRIDAPIVVWWQLVRHRTASINLQSGRYTEYDDNVYIPSAWRLQATKNKQASEGVHSDSALIEDLFEEHVDRSYQLYRRAIAMGVAREQARLFLPAFALRHVGIWTMDAHNLMHFIGLRVTDEAQHEIRAYAKEIWRIFENVLPKTAQAYIMNVHGGNNIL